MKFLRLRNCLTAWAILGLGFVIPASQKLDDPDFWWHLKTGELIWANRSVPAADPFSFTCLGRHWITHEWLSELAYYGVFAHFGFVGVILVVSVLVSAMFAGIYVLVRRRIENHPVALGITALCGLAAWQLWSPRPQLLTYFLLIGLLLVLENPVGRRIWLAVPMFLLWSNLHGAWIFGFGVMTVILGDAALAAICAGKASNARRPALVWACSLLAVLMGPSPLERLVYPLQYFTGRIPSGYVSEFQSPDFRDPMVIPYELLLLAAAGLLYLGHKPMRASWWILLVLTAVLSLSSVRHVPLFAIIAAPVLAIQAQSALERRPRSGLAKRPDELRESPLVNLILLLLLPVLAWSQLPRANDEAHCVSPKLFPTRAAGYLVDYPRIGHGRLLNTYNWGGYLIFHLYPKYRVSVDGRADIHCDHMVRDHEALEELSPSWEKELRRLDPDLIFWPTKKPLATVLAHDGRWRILYRDRTAVVFARRADSP